MIADNQYDHEVVTSRARLQQPGHSLAPSNQPLQAAHLSGRFILTLWVDSEGSGVKCLNISSICDGTFSSQKGSMVGMVGHCEN